MTTTETTVESQDIFDPGEEHWLHVDPNGDHWLQHPNRDKDMIEVDCHHDLAQCPVALHVAHRFLKHPTFDFGATWARTRNTPGAPHHTVFMVLSYEGDAIHLFNPALGVHGEFTLHEHGPEHGHSIVTVGEDGKVKFHHADKKYKEGVERHVTARLLMAGEDDPGLEPGEYVSYPIPWNTEQGHQLFKVGQRK